ncbi:MAG TPA: LysM peptidoglycan-binding domain-containing protein, partial [Candidatus Acidoferrum sp.]
QVLFAACAFSAGAPVWAQDVAEAARQEQARKEKHAKRLKHVYTEEDLKRKRILTRADRELLAAQKREENVPGAVPPVGVDAEALENLPLGDVARMFRAQKELDAAMRAAEYHLGVDSAVLASPRPMVAFVMARPREVQATLQTMPVAPVLPNATTPVVKADFVASKAPASPGAPVAVVSRANRHAAKETKSKFEFRMSKPMVLQPANAAMPVAPVFAEVTPVASGALALHAAGPAPVNPAVTVARAIPAVSPTAFSRSIVVKAGDSLWKLAQTLLGDGHRWKEIAAANPGIANPKHIVPGMALNVAGSVPATPMTPSAPANSKVLVHKGDSLWKIAQTKLGSGGFWGCIAKANPMILDADRIYAGQFLDLPLDCGTKHE